METESGAELDCEYKQSGGTNLICGHALSSLPARGADSSQEKPCRSIRWRGAGFRYIQWRKGERVMIRLRERLK